MQFYLEKKNNIETIQEYFKTGILLIYNERAFDKKHFQLTLIAE